MKLPIGCNVLDSLLGGGVESGIITEFYGEAATGKTTICLLLTKSCALSKMPVAFIDTEGVSIERMEQICGESTEEVQSKLLLYGTYSLRGQEKAIETLENLKEKVGMIILDSATTHYRVELANPDSGKEAIRRLSRQLNALLTLGRKNDVPVVITNQVYTNLDTGTLEPVGGQIMMHIAKAIVRLDRVGQGIRRATLIKHRSMPEGSFARFAITSKGLEGAQGAEDGN
jgi:DNA repair protein RadB